VEAVHLDTHIAAWLWQGRADRVRRILRRLKGRTAEISPAVVLELQVLHEIGRLTDDAEGIVASLARGVGLGIAQADFADAVGASLRLGWCRDPFDRLIVGHAMASGCRLLTCDDSMLKNCSKAFDL
jgi:PIN domain nuclease of toxin-antitoxin system